MLQKQMKDDGGIIDVIDVCRQQTGIGGDRKNKERRERADQQNRARSRIIV